MALSALSITLLALLLTWVIIKNRFQAHTSQLQQELEAEKPDHLARESLSKPARLLRSKLVAALPHIVILPENSATFINISSSYWDQKAYDSPPSCIVRPRNVWELSQAVKILKREFDLQVAVSNEELEPLFAIRGGGHSPVAGASSIKGGVLVDLGLFKAVTLSPDRNSVAIGAGCKWIDVSKTLDEQGLAVVGGRNSAVGVGGLTLGGGLSFFSPRFGFVCSNIIEYEVVLADGTVVTTSESSHPALWRALKGGSNNYGIVTRFTARSFPQGNIWSGFLYLPSCEASRVISSLYNFINSRVVDGDSKTRDQHAAGPLACFTYLQQLGIQAIAINLVNTDDSSQAKEWPACWKGSGFSKLWRFWSTCRSRSLSSATDELSVLNPPGRRQEFVTTTIKNDLATLEAVHKVYREAIDTICKHNIKKMSWTLVLQPFLPDWAQKGDNNPLGFSSDRDEPLVIVSFTINWAQSQDDEIVQSIAKSAIEEIDAYAETLGTDHRYRYLNYCASWQKPFSGYGEENSKFLKDTSREFDPDGLFQKGCIGGFKLGL